MSHGFGLPIVYPYPNSIRVFYPFLSWSYILCGVLCVFLFLSYSDFFLFLSCVYVIKFGAHCQALFHTHFLHRLIELLIELVGGSLELGFSFGVWWLKSAGVKYIIILNHQTSFNLTLSARVVSLVNRQNPGLMTSAGLTYRAAGIPLAVLTLPYFREWCWSVNPAAVHDHGVHIIFHTKELGRSLIHGTGHSRYWCSLCPLGQIEHSTDLEASGKDIESSGKELNARQDNH